MTEQLPIDERHLYTEGYLKDSLAIRMGGRVAEEVASLLREAEQRARGMLGDHRQALDRLTELLLERETVDGTDVDQFWAAFPASANPSAPPATPAPWPPNGGDHWRGRHRRPASDGRVGHRPPLSSSARVRPRPRRATGG